MLGAVDNFRIQLSQSKFLVVIYFRTHPLPIPLQALLNLINNKHLVRCSVTTMSSSTDREHQHVNCEDTAANEHDATFDLLLLQALRYERTSTIPSKSKKRYPILTIGKK